MPLRDFALLMAVCLVWGSNNIVSKLVVGPMAVPPLFYAAARFAVAALAVLPWLKAMPRPRWRMLVVAQLMGAGNFALIFMGLQTATPSAAAVVMQLGVPMTTLLSMFMLGERVRWRRGIGMALTFAGALSVMWNPGGFAVSIGLLQVAGAVFLGSLGSVMIKQMEHVRPIEFQAWICFTSVWPLALLSAWLEPGQVEAALAAGWPFVAAVLYSGLAVSVIAHTTYYWLIQRHEATLIAPLTLVTPLATIALGVLVTHDPFGLRMAVGSAVALAGVLIIALRPNQVMPMLIALRNRLY